MRTIRRIRITVLTKPLGIDAGSALAAWQPQLREASEIFVGLSGGLDSVVLLNLLLKTVPAKRVSALHIHHGLSPNADHWQAAVVSHCEKLGVRLHVEQVEVRESGEGLEAAARKARYEVFERMLQPSGLLVLGHHADDQVETVLYHLLRGSGTKGLSGMPAQRSLGGGCLIRPLLQWRKADLKLYAEAQGLSWVEDESNAQDQYDRNFLRNQVIPVIAQRWPDYDRSVQLSAQLSGDAELLAEELATIDIAQLQPRRERGGWSIDIGLLSALSGRRQRNIMRHWPALHNLPMPGYKTIDEITDSLLTARQDANPLVTQPSAQWRRFNERLYLLSIMPLSPETKEDFQWDLAESLELSDGSYLIAEQSLGEGLSVVDKEPLTVRYRQGGERCKPEGRGHSNSLKKLLLEYRVEPWWRDSLPLLYRGETLVAVGDYWVCEGWQAKPGQPGKKILWQPNSL